MKTLARPADRTELLHRLRRVRRESRRRWGRMSAHQMICHLADALRMAIGERSVTRASGLPQRTLLKWIALYAPFRWPPGIETSPEIDQALGGTPPGDFTTDVAQVEALMERFATGATHLDLPLHPVFGTLSATAWLRWGYLHLDHHLRQFGA